MPGGQELRVVAEVPFADHAGGVALGLEQFGERGLVGVNAVACVRPERPVDADAIGVATGEQ